MKQIKLFLPLVILLITGFKTSAVSVVKIVSGMVTDRSDGSPLPGVAILAPASKRTTTTDKYGKYTIELAPEDKQLRFSSIGFKQITIKIKGDRLNVTLEEDNHALSEVVVVGYGTAKKSVATSSVSTFSAPALEGRIAGVSVKAAKSAGSSYASEKKAPPAIGTIHNPRPQSNQLTAGEWNDLDHWDFWKDLMNNQEWSGKQSHWEFYPKNRLSIHLQNKEEQPLNNYTVTVFTGGKELWKAQTNFEGKAELWPSLYSNRQQQITVTVTAANGKELYRKNSSATTKSLNITVDSRPQKITDLDVMFMVDATGSMGDEINYLKAELEDIIGRLNGNSNINTRTGMVFYRDRGDEYVVRDFGFDNDLYAVKQNLNKQYASGGGDFEEAVEEAMDNAINQQRWTTSTSSAKIMFMILDAPPHYDQARVKSIQRSVQSAAAKGIILIPVAASGIDKNTEFLMRFMAMGTNGTYVFLTDDSGIGNSHLKPTVGNYQVEHLNNLLHRLIKKYAGLDTNKDRYVLTSDQ